VNTPTINVNLAPCVCGGPLPRLLTEGPDVHPGGCPGAPILIPCPIPRSVTVKVPLGACQCRIAGRRALIEFLGAGDSFPGGINAWHDFDCPARPVKASCSISGSTWEESEVVDVDNPHENDGRWGAESGDAFRTALSACNDRWALFKALVLGHTDLSQWLTGPKVLELLTQRDTVYAALADMARAEQVAYEAQNAVSMVCGRGVSAYHRTAAHERPSAHWLAAYVERLLEQVEVLP
jgi:hypothetical protein